MKRAVLAFGLISGAIAILLMLATIPFINKMDHRGADVVGYSSMVLSALLVYFGIRSYRERSGEVGGAMTWSRGLLVGVLITLVSCACIIVAFQIVYFHLVPDFGEKFSACMIDRSRTAGDSPEKVEAVTQQARRYKELFDNPLTNAALYFATTFPIGLGASAISALILRRR
jgi:amino acid transporter